MRKNLGMALPVGLISFVLVSQLFDYRHLSFSPSVRMIFFISPDRLLFLVLLVVSGYAFLDGQLQGRSSDRVEIYVMFLFALLCTLSWFSTGLDFGSPVFRWLATLFNLIYFPFVVYLLVKNTRYSRAATVSLLWVITGIGTYLVLTAIFEHFRLDALVWPKYILDASVGVQVGRARGPFATSVTLGQWLIVTFMSTSLLIQFAKALLRFFLLYLLVPFTVLAIYFTDQRSVWLGFTAVLAITIVFGGKLRAQSLHVVLLILLTFFLGIGSKFSIYTNTLFSRRQSTVDYRLANYRTAFKMGMSNLITGVGYGNFVHEWEAYYDPAEAEFVSGGLADGNHNTYLGLFAETGIFGSLLYVSLFLCLIRKCVSVWRHRSPAEDFERDFTILAGALVVVAMNEALFSDLRFNPAGNTLLYL